MTGLGLPDSLSGGCGFVTAVLSSLDPTLGCLMLVLRVSLCKKPEKCVCHPNTMELLFTRPTQSFTNSITYRSPELAFAFGFNSSSLYVKENKSLGNIFAGHFGKQLIFLPTDVLRSALSGCESRWLGPLSSSEFSDFRSLKSAIVGVFPAQK